MLSRICLLMFYFIVSGCPTSCVSCYINSELCQRCLVGYWLTNDFNCHPCPGGCAECSNNVHCTKCKANYWGISTCNFKCFGICDENGCDDVSGYCHQCKSGYYGQSCDQDCVLCKKQSCSSRQCTDGCVDGYYEYTSDDKISCQQCHQKCAVCERFDYCLECKKGFYKLYYNSDGINRIYCSQCEQNCEECTVRSKCTVCQPGTYGSKCENTCKLSNCYRCTGSNKNIEKCIECEPGYEFNENECVPCVNINGICSEECTAGYWGEYCNITCYEGCASCNQTNGYCNVCHHNRYGEYCNFTCSEHCADDGNILLVCSKMTGKCERGCEDGYTDDRCDIFPFTVSSGHSPSTTVKKADKLVESSQQHIGLFIGGGAGGGAFIIAVVVVVIVCAVRRRKWKRTNNKKNVIEEREYENTAVTMQVFSSEETSGDIGNLGCNPNTVETVLSVYERLDDDTRDDQHQYSGYNQNTTETVANVYERVDGDTRDDHHQYSGLERRTDQHDANYVNM